MRERPPDRLYRRVLTFVHRALTLVLTHQGLETSVEGQRIGYARVSTIDQNEERQLDGHVC